MIKKIKHVWRKKIPIGKNEEEKTSLLSAELIGAPDDRGVLNVGGRVGAGMGPQALREILGGFMLGLDNAFEVVQFNAGSDISTNGTIEETHQQLRSLVCQKLSDGVFPIVVGGGHDLGFPHAAGVSDFFKGKIGLINFDAHLDMAPPINGLISSRNPFYFCLENKIVQPRNLFQFGIQDHCNDSQFYHYALGKKVNILRLQDCRKGNGVLANFQSILKTLEKKKLKTVVSFDMDAIQMAYAPGVSAPQVDGFTSTDFIEILRLCGRTSSVVSVGFFEFAPYLDENKKTARLLATGIHHLVSALASRLEDKKTNKSTLGRIAGKLIRD